MRPRRIFSSVVIAHYAKVFYVYFARRICWPGHRITSAKRQPNRTYTGNQTHQTAKRNFKTAKHRTLKPQRIVACGGSSSRTNVERRNHGHGPDIRKWFLDSFFGTSERLAQRQKLNFSNEKFWSRLGAPPFTTFDFALPFVFLMKSFACFFRSEFFPL